MFVFVFLKSLVYVKLCMHVICFCICICFCFSLKTNKLQLKTNKQTNKQKQTKNKNKKQKTKDKLEIKRTGMGNPENRLLIMIFFQRMVDDFDDTINDVRSIIARKV